MTSTLIVDQSTGPYVNITSAISAIPTILDDDYVIEVHEGEYNESVTIQKTAGAFSILLKGIYGNPEAVRVYINNTTLNIQSKNVTVQDMFFDSLQVFSFTNTVKVGSVFSGNTDDNNVLINRCRLKKAGGYRTVEVGYGGTTVQNCIITGTGIPFSTANNSGLVKFLNNTVIWESNFRGFDVGVGSTFHLKNNIMYKTDEDIEGSVFIDIPGDATYELSNNCYYAPLATNVWEIDNVTYLTLESWATASGETNSFNTDPLLVDYLNDNFSLNGSSELINTGASLVADGVATDYSGGTRPKNTYYEIGAIEAYINPALTIGGDIQVIPTLTAFPGDAGEVSIVWTRPKNSTSATIYEYNLIENYDLETNPGSETSWVPIGTESEIYNLSVGDHLDGFIPYLFKNLNNDSTYRIYLRAKSYVGVTPGKEPATLDFGEDVYVDVTPKEFSRSEPNPERLMRVLPRNFKAKENRASLLHQMFEKIAYHIRGFHTDLIEQGLTQLNILTATDEFVDNWGVLFSVDRQANETDAEYGARIVRSFTIEKATPKGIKKAVQPYSSEDVLLIEGSRNQNTFVFDLSYFDFDPYSPDRYLYADLVPHVIDRIPSAEEVEDRTGIKYQVPPNSGNFEFLYGNEFGQGSGDSFIFTIRFKPIPTGDPASIANTVRVVRNIVSKYKLAGTQFTLEIIE